MKKHTILAFAIAFLAITALPLHAALQDNLILYFPFDGSDGEEDQSGGGHDGNLNGGAEIIKDEVMVGTGALKIEESGAGMEVFTFTELEEYQDNSFLFWLYYIEGSNGDWSQIIAKPGGSDRSPGIWMNPGNTGIHYRYDPGNAGFGAIGPNGEGSTFDVEQWYHIAGVKKEAQLTFYVDGEQKGQVAVPASHNQAPGSLLVGKSGYRAATFIIDDLAVYDRALDEDEVVDVMNGKLAKTPVEAAGKLASTWGNVKNRH